VGDKARTADGYKLWYSGSTKVRNGVGILVEKESVDFVVEVRVKVTELWPLRSWWVQKSSTWLVFMLLR